MKALSLLQPWASLVVMGAKKIETRSWSTPYRGEILIHASLGKAGGIVARQPAFTRFIPDFNKLPFGAIIGCTVLTKILRVEDFGLSASDMDKLTLEEKAFGDYTHGRYGWILENAVQYDEPLVVRGHLRLWDI